MLERKIMQTSHTTPFVPVPCGIDTQCRNPVVQKNTFNHGLLDMLLTAAHVLERTGKSVFPVFLPFGVLAGVQGRLGCRVVFTFGHVRRRLK